METYTLTEPPKATIPDESEAKPKTFFQKFGKFIIGGGVVFGLLLMFVLGMTISRGSTTSQISPTAVPPTPTTSSVSPVISPKTNPENAPIMYQPGKKYYDDSIAIITREEPHRALFFSAARHEQAKNYTQYTKLNYYNGTSWLRDALTTTNAQLSVVSNPLLREWTMKPGVVTNGNQALSFTIENQIVTFTLRNQSYEVSTQALPGFTKFTYFGEGILKTVDGEQPANIAYTQLYADSAANLAYLNTPERVTSSWLVFWDSASNVYMMESLVSAQTSNVYQNYNESVFYSNATQTFQKASGSTLNLNAQNNQYTANFTTKPQARLTFQMHAPLNKASKRTYINRDAYITGNIQVGNEKRDGVGLIQSVQPL